MNELLPHEKLALDYARYHALAGRTIGPDMAAVLVETLDRLTSDTPASDD